MFVEYDMWFVKIIKVYKNRFKYKRIRFIETTFGTKMNLKDNRNTDFLDSSNV